MIRPQALPNAIPPTVGILVQLAKGTARPSIVGLDELRRAGQVMFNATFHPLQILALVALLYPAMGNPRALGTRYRERRLTG